MTVPYHPNRNLAVPSEPTPYDSGRTVTFQVEVNRSLSDRFPTSWSVHRGHHFFLWHKILPSLEGALQPQQSAIATAEDGEVRTAVYSDFFYCTQTFWIKHKIGEVGVVGSRCAPYVALSW